MLIATDSFTIFGAVCGLLLATQVSAQAGQECVGVENDIARLDCFDTAFADNPPLPVASSGEWGVEKSTDPMTDFEVVLLSTFANEESCNLHPAAFFVRCDATGPALFFSHGCYAPGNHNGRVSASIRFGDSNPVARLMYADTTGEAAGYWGDQPVLFSVLEDILESDRIAVQVETVRNIAPALVFDVRGLAETIMSSGIGCGFSEIAATQ